MEVSGGTILGIPIIRIRVFGDLYWSPPILWKLPYIHGLGLSKPNSSVSDMYSYSELENSQTWVQHRALLGLVVTPFQPWIETINLYSPKP